MRTIILSLLAVTAGSSLGCLNDVEPPPPSPQATVRFPTQLFIAGEGSRGFCERLFLIGNGDGNSIGNLTPVDGDSSTQIDESIPHNCYVEVTTDGAMELPVEQHEVTNLQYQLCHDSGACRAPDPSEVTKSDVCDSEDDFDECPVVGVSYEQADDYCEWVGRRLPSGMESTMIRQAALQTTTSSNFPLSVPILPFGEGIPGECQRAVLGNGSCSRPSAVTGDGGSIGAGEADVVQVAMGRGEGSVFDLVGNVAEMIGDLSPDRRAGADGLPWFCVGDLPQRIQNPNQPFSQANPPQCPSGLSCIRGRYRPAPDLPIGDYPVCITASRGQTTGTRPVLVGASYFEELLEDGQGNGDGMRSFRARDIAGVFARRVIEEDLDRFPDTQIGRRTGFRCVGQRASASGDERAPPFDDRLLVR